MTDCGFAENLAQIHQRTSFFSGNHENPLMCFDEFEGVTFRSSSWWTGRKRIPLATACSTKLSPCSNQFPESSHIYSNILDGLFQVFQKILPFSKETLYMSFITKSRREDMWKVRGCHLFFGSSPLDKVSKELHCWRCQMLRSSAVVKLQEIGKLP